MHLRGFQLSSTFENHCWYLSKIWSFVCFIICLTQLCSVMSSFFFFIFCLIVGSLINCSHYEATWCCTICITMFSRHNPLLKSDIILNLLASFILIIFWSVFCIHPKSEKKLENEENCPVRPEWETSKNIYRAVFPPPSSKWMVKGMEP